MATIDDLFTAVENGGSPQPSTVAEARESGATTLVAESLTNWPTTGAPNADSAVFCITAPTTVNSAGLTVLDTTQLMLWKAVVSGATLTDLTLMYSVTGSDIGNSIGDVVQMAPSSAWGQALYEGLMINFNNDGTFQTGAVGTDAIAAGAITSDALAQGAITADNIAAGAITLGYTSVTTSVSLTSTSDVEIISLSVTIPEGGRNIEIDFYSPLLSSPINDTTIIKLWTGSVGGTQIGEYEKSSPSTTSTGPQVGLLLKAIHTPDAGPLVYYVSGSASAKDSSIAAYSYAPAYLIVKAV